MALLVPECCVEDGAAQAGGVLQPREHAVVDLVKDAGNADEQRGPQRLNRHQRISGGLLRGIIRGTVASQILNCLDSSNQTISSWGHLLRHAQQVRANFL